MRVGLLMTLLAFPLAAQTAPTIPAAIQTRYTQAQAQAKADLNAVQTAHAKQEASHAALIAVIKEMKAACGDSQLRHDSKGNPVCISISKVEVK